MKHDATTFLRALTLLIPGLAAVPVAADEPLRAAEIVEAVAGATTSGVNAYGNPYTVEIREGGTTWGIAGLGNEYEDTGTWWLEDDRFCRRWTTWLEGHTACFAVFIAGGKITWVDAATGDARVEDYTPPQ